MFAQRLLSSNGTESRRSTKHRFPQVSRHIGDRALMLKLRSDRRDPVLVRAVDSAQAPRDDAALARHLNIPLLLDSSWRNAAENHFQAQEDDLKKKCLL